MFIGLVLGLLVAASNQTIISPAMPTIVADLGGVEHYSWALSSVMLTSAVAVPVVGKLSDLYGRRGLYGGGLVLFMAGSALAGTAQGFWWLVAARIVQGLGMGTVIPLSQTIIADMVSPRERGRYMGYLGAVFGISWIAGPIAGGWITQSLSWRWLFFVSLPLGLVALAFVFAFFSPSSARRTVSVDYTGFATLTLGLAALLVATSWGGTSYPWASLQVAGLYGASALALFLFILNERRVPEPALPLELFKNPVFTLSNLANFLVSMAMFGAIFYIPLFARGVLGLGVANSGQVLIPMTLTMVVVSIVTGRLITRTGRYKVFLLAGTLVMGAGYLLLSSLGYGSSWMGLALAMVVTGLGLGALLQTYVLVVQNATAPELLGVCTAATMFSRFSGATIGAAVFGTILNSRMHAEVAERLPRGAAAGPQTERFTGGGSGVGAVLDPQSLSGLSPAVEGGVREGLAAAMHPMFVVGVGVLAAAFVATLFIREFSLRRTTPEEESVAYETTGEVEGFSRAEGKTIDP